MKGYDTGQRRALLSYLSEHPDQQFTVEELSRALDGISLSAIYRNIQRGIIDGFIQRFPMENSRKFCYQYIGGKNCETHLHVKCDECGQVYHLDAQSTEAILGAMRAQDFNVDRRKSILYGACKLCRDK